MVVGVCYQRIYFKPRYSTYLWFSKSMRRSSSATSSFLNHLHGKHEKIKQSSDIFSENNHDRDGAICSHYRHTLKFVQPEVSPMALSDRALYHSSKSMKWGMPLPEIRKKSGIKHLCESSGINFITSDSAFGYGFPMKWKIDDNYRYSKNSWLEESRKLRERRTGQLSSSSSDIPRNVYQQDYVPQNIDVSNSQNVALFGEIKSVKPYKQSYKCIIGNSSVQGHMGNLTYVPFAFSQTLLVEHNHNPAFSGMTVRGDSTTSPGTCSLSMVTRENYLRNAKTKVPAVYKSMSEYERKPVKLSELEEVKINDEIANTPFSSDTLGENSSKNINPKKECQENNLDKLLQIYGQVLIIDNKSSAKNVVKMLTTKYRHLIHACDTEVAKIDVRLETPVDHGEIICFSIYSGPGVDFGDGKSCIWVDVLDGGKELLLEFSPFFEDSSIKKVWHNYSFDSHILENYGLKLSGFYADTMHLARLWDSSRRIDGGYSLEALTGDLTVMNNNDEQHRINTAIVNNKDRELTGDPMIMNDKNMPPNNELLTGKLSMKSIFGKKKINKNGLEGKLITIAPVEELQRERRIPWICYSALDSISTLKLFDSLRKKLMAMDWFLDGVARGSMYDFYEEYWRPFGEILVKMETEGMLVDLKYLSEMEKLAVVEKQVAVDRFRKWASKYCVHAMYMNVGSDVQLRQLLFAGMPNRINPRNKIPDESVFKLPSNENVDESKKVTSKYRNIKLHGLGIPLQAESYTSSGWPSVCGNDLKTFAGKLSVEQYDMMVEENEIQSSSKKEVYDNVNKKSVNEDVNVELYGTAYTAFGGDISGKEACRAFALLCEASSIDILISNFLLPLQGSHISGKDGRIHCSLNINTETGRLSARRPNLQNQPALEKDRYKIRQAFIAKPGNSLIVADYGQLELRILAHLTNCKSMLDAFKAGGDFHSRTAINMYPYIKEAVEEGKVLLEWDPKYGQEKPPVPLLKDAYAAERRIAKAINFSIAYGKTSKGLSRDLKISSKKAKETIDLWYKERKEVLVWQEARKANAIRDGCVHTLLGRARRFPSVAGVSYSQKCHIERAAINTPVQGSAADVAMCAMIEISRNTKLKEFGWKLLLQVHDEVILEGPTESAEIAKAIVVECMSKPFYGVNYLKVDLAVDAKCAQNWYAAK